jgi:capsular exopolysaccharide synthesis family protein
MQAPLPIASYGFILRKHLWLVLGTMAVVLAGGWFYGKTQSPVFQATAILDIQSKVSIPGTTQTLVMNDTQFVNNMLYGLRNDKDMAKKVMERLLETKPGEPPVPGASVLRDMDPSTLPSRVTVEIVPTTTYYRFSIQGPDREACVVLVNAYARVFAEVFSKRRTEQAMGYVKDFREQRTEKEKELQEQSEAIAKFKTANPKVDFDREPGKSDKEEAELLSKQLTQERSRLITLQHQKETVERTLKAVGLRLEDCGDEGFKVLPPPAAATGEEPRPEDPRLSERVQGLDAVAGNESVRKARGELEEAVDADRKLEKELKLNPETPERKLARARIDRQRAAFARTTEAALVRLAQQEGETRSVVKDWETQLKTLDDRIGVSAKALAGHEVMQRKLRGIETSIAEYTNLILGAESQRKKLEEDGGTLRVYQYAQEGSAKLVAPNKPVIYLTTAIAALLLAAALAYVLEFLDDSVKSREDFDRLVRLPFLGYVPHIKEVEGTSRDLTVARGRTGSPEVESFRAIRTGIQFSRADREVRMFLVTSAGPGEGKTTVSVNIASAFAGGKGRVLLIDADLRRARVHKALGIDNSRGLTNVLVGESSLADAIQKSSVEGLDVMAAGPIPPNPAEVLGSERMQEVLKEAAGRWDRVIVDSPPLVAVTDPALLAKYVDAVFLVISIGKTSIRSIQRARETLAGVGCSISGAVLNNADLRLSGYAETYGGYGYGYGYGYGATPKKA